MLVQDTLTGYFHEVPDSQLYDVDFAEFQEPYGEAQMVYDGFGNPVGLAPALLPVATAFAPAAGRLFRGLFGRRSRRSPVGPTSALLPIAAGLAPAAGGLIRGLFQRRRPPPPAPQPMVAPPPDMVAPPPPTTEMMPESAPAEEPPMGQFVYDGLGNPVGISPYMPAIRSFPQGALQQRQPWRPPWPQGWIRPPLPYTGLGPRRLYMRCAVWPGPRGLVPVSAAQAQAPAVGPVPPAVGPVPPAAAMAQMGRRRSRRRRR
jgi:hypothetical protein